MNRFSTSKIILLALFSLTASIATSQTKTPPAPHKTSPVASSPQASTLPASLYTAMNELQTTIQGLNYDQHISTKVATTTIEMQNHVSYSQVAADPSRCTLGWVETTFDSEDKITTTHTASIKLREVGNHSATPMTPMEGYTKTPANWDVGIWMIPGFKTREQVLAVSSAGKQYQNSNQDGLYLSISVGTQDEANRVSSALDKAMYACQQTAPAALLNASSAPTASASVDFINGELSSQGAFHYVMHRSGDREGDINNVINSQSFSLITNCISDFELDGGTDFKQSMKVPLEELDPRSIEVEEYGLYLHKSLLKQNPNPLNINFAIDPPVYIVTNQGFYALFTDRLIAERVAKAYIHAIVVCGGGKDQPF